MKKKFFSTLALAVFIATASFAQFEVKINPVGLLWGGVTASGEVVFADNMGAELTLGLANTGVNIFTDGDTQLNGFKATGAFKYYFSPIEGGDGFYAGPYLKYRLLSGKYDSELTNQSESVDWNKVAVGLLAGYKWVAESGLLFEISAGAGRSFVSNISSSEDDESYDFSSIPFLNIDLVGKLAVGYRF
jgi:hypothetical protein